jgi:RimJ/RimL family protein N-acetyltransferase
MRHFISWLLRPRDAGGLGLRRVRLTCSAANVASRGVLEKLGIPLEATLRREEHVPGVGITDRLGWGVLAEEWDTNAHRTRP